jgi:hypothetical protein
VSRIRLLPTLAALVVLLPRPSISAAEITAPSTLQVNLGFVPLSNYELQPQPIKRRQRFAGFVSRRDKHQGVLSSGIC